MTARDNGVDLIALGWNNSRIYTFISTMGTTLPAEPAKVHRHDPFHNITTIPISRPKIIEIYQEAAGVIDQHNKIRQRNLGLEKRWVTMRWDFRIITSIFGIVEVDSYLIAKHVITGFSMSNPDFVNVLSMQLIQMGQATIGPPSRAIANFTGTHRLVSYGRYAYQNKEGELREGARQQNCKWCAWKSLRSMVKTSFYCEECDLALCHPTFTTRNCFQNHITEKLIPPRKRRQIILVRET